MRLAFENMLLVVSAELFESLRGIKRKYKKTVYVIDLISFQIFIFNDGFHTNNFSADP
jgi:hypothetical protein